MLHAAGIAVSSGQSVARHGYVRNAYAGVLQMKWSEPADSGMSTLPCMWTWFQYATLGDGLSNKGPMQGTANDWAFDIAPHATCGYVSIVRAGARRQRV